MFFIWGHILSKISIIAVVDDAIMVFCRQPATGNNSNNIISTMEQMELSADTDP